MTAPLCAGRRDDGSPCTNKPKKGTRHCRWHPEKTAAEVLPVNEDDLRRAGLTLGFSFSEMNVEVLAGRTFVYAPQDQDVLTLSFPVDESLLSVALVDTDGNPVPSKWRQGEVTFRFRTTFHALPASQIGCQIRDSEGEEWNLRHHIPASERSFLDDLERIRRRNELLGITVPQSLLDEAIADLDEPIQAASHAIPEHSRRQGGACALPVAVPQPTFQESRNTAIAIADGRTLSRWEPVTGEIAWRHAISKQPIQTKLIPGAMLDWWGLPTTHESLGSEIQGLGFSATVLWHLCVGMILESEKGQIEVSLDALIKAIGWEPQTADQRDAMRLKVWRWLLLFSSLWSVGQRTAGKYRDRVTREVIPLGPSVDQMIILSGFQTGGQQSLDRSVPPLLVKLTAGPWLMGHHGNRRILPSFGDIRRIASIPSGKPSGAWAQSIGMALVQKWRERSADSSPVRTGDANALSVRMKSFTRRELLEMFRCEPYFEDVLNSEHAGRVRLYWRQALNLLKEREVVGFYQEQGTPATGQTVWKNAWLDQELDIRPQTDGVKRMAEISRTARSVRKTRTRSGQRSLSA